MRTTGRSLRFCLHGFYVVSGWLEFLTAWWLGSTEKRVRERRKRKRKRRRQRRNRGVRTVSLYDLALETP